MPQTAIPSCKPQIPLRLVSLLILFITLSPFWHAVLHAQAPLSLSGIFQDNMVLQQEAPLPIWGHAPANSPITVRLGEHTAKATATENGQWKAILPELKATAKPRDLIIASGPTTLTRKNIVIGEVWVAAGQSNMNAGGPNKPTGMYPFYQTPQTKHPLPPIRFMRYGWGASLEAQTDAVPWLAKDGPWKNIMEDNFNSVNTPVQFARVLRDTLKVPVGIVHVSVSGTNQGAWMKREVLEQFPSKKKENFYQELLASHQDKLKKNKALNNWEGFKKAETQWINTKTGRWPGGSTVQNFPTALYNTRIHPLAPFAIKGVIWHQGEGGPGGPYGERLVAMIRQWRKHFEQDFYFIWGTLSRSTPDSPPLTPSLDYFYRSGTNLSIRKALNLFENDPKVALTEFYDLGDTDTHWLIKTESGRRMALAALTKAYGQSHNYSPPRSTNITFENGAAIVTFDLVGNAISYTPSFEGISGIVVKGKSKAQVWGEVEVMDKNTIKITHPKGEPISMVAYAYNRNPHETLFDSEGLPASPFGHAVGRVPYQPTGPKILTVTNMSKKQGHPSLAHVRQDGYRFQLVRFRRAAKGHKATARATLSSQWAASEVLINSTAVNFKTENQDGRKVAVFEVPVDGTWVTVCKKGAGKQFKDIKRY